MADRTASQYDLLKTKRFFPFFLTQFFGAFNDNVYKNALILLIAFSVIDVSINTNVIINFAALIFILPFFIFSANAGQIADKVQKSLLIRRIKLLEIGIMLLASVAPYLESLTGLLAVLFLMGTQSAFFGPVKYSIIPQQLDPEELVGGNALVEMGTFVAIICGTIIANLLTDATDPALFISVSVLLFAVLGYLSSRAIPATKASAPELKINWNILTQTAQVMRYATRDRTVFLSIMGISWFWLLGAAYLTQVPAYAKTVLGGSADVVTLLLVLFSIGIAIGSLLCDRLSGHKVEIGLVPFGSLGLSLFGIDMFFIDIPEPSGELIGIVDAVTRPGIIRALFDLCMIGVFGGFFVVPLFALVQYRADERQRAQIIAAGNIFNALFMVVAALFGILFLGVLDFSIPQFFFTLAVMNIAVAIFIYSLVPEFAMRFLVWLIGHTMYRVRHEGLDNIPAKGPAVLVCNHVSYVDAVLLAGASRRPIRFVMHKPIYDLPVLNFIFRVSQAIPIVSRLKDLQTYERAFERIDQELTDGHLVCIFPEGKLTTDGELDVFKKGVERILDRNKVPVVPIALRGLWGSVFSRKQQSIFSALSSGLRPVVDIVVGPGVPVEQANSESLYEVVHDLLDKNYGVKADF
jgi:1-acyl-sn-glycerol-3-phosphate acyltransferase